MSNHDNMNDESEFYDDTESEYEFASDSESEEKNKETFDISNTINKILSKDELDILYEKVAKEYNKNGKLNIKIVG